MVLYYSTILILDITPLIASSYFFFSSNSFAYEQTFTISSKYSFLELSSHINHNISPITYRRTILIIHNFHLRIVSYQDYIQYPSVYFTLVFSTTKESFSFRITIKTHSLCFSIILPNPDIRRFRAYTCIIGVIPIFTKSTLTHFAIQAELLHCYSCFLLNCSAASK